MFYLLWVIFAIFFNCICHALLCVSVVLLSCLGNWFEFYHFILLLFSFMEVKCSLSTLFDMAMQFNPIILAVNVLGGFCRAFGQKSLIQSDNTDWWSLMTRVA